MRNEGSDCDLNDIDTSLITDMSRIFAFSAFCGNVSKWDVSKVKNMEGMFKHSKFNQDISNWKIQSNCKTYDMFYNCSIDKKFIPKSLQ